MSFRNVRKQAAEDRTQPAWKGINQAAVLANLHYTEPKRQHTCQAERDFECRFRWIEGGVDDLCEYLGIAEEQKFADGNYESNHEECDPDVI